MHFCNLIALTVDEPLIVWMLAGGGAGRVRQAASGGLAEGAAQGAGLAHHPAAPLHPAAPHPPGHQAAQPRLCPDHRQQPGWVPPPPPPGEPYARAYAPALTALTLNLRPGQVCTS